MKEPPESMAAEFLLWKGRGVHPYWAEGYEARIFDVTLIRETLGGGSNFDIVPAGCSNRKATAALKYSPELDGLRALAVVAVVLFHCEPFGPLKGGFVGVDLFFVLSGFLITTILKDEVERTGSVNLIRFYKRRLLRLWPALILMLAAYLALAPIAWPNYPHRLSASIAGLYLSDIALPLSGIPKYLEHTWSLAIEEQFYLLWPIGLIFLLKAKRPVFWLVISLIAEMLWRGSFGWWREYYYRPDTHSTGLILGAILCFSGLTVNRLAGLAGLVLMAFLFAVGNIRGALYCIPFAELAAFLMVASVPRGGLRGFAHPALVHIGKLSYGIYLWHFPLAFWARKFDFPATAAIALPTSYALALISYHTVELWARRLATKGVDRAGLGAFNSA